MTYTPSNSFLDPDKDKEAELNRQQVQQMQSTITQSQIEEEQQKQQQAADLANKTDPKTGQPKKPHDALQPKEFGFNENVQEAGNAILGGLTDTANDVLSLSKYADPEFYKEGEKYKPDYWQIEQPITKTAWGNIIRTGVNVLSLGAATAFGAGRLAGPISRIPGAGQAIAAGLKWYSQGKSTWKGKLAQGAAQDAVAGVISRQSQGDNVAASLIKLKPEWSDNLKQFATEEDMSPAQRSMYNIVESITLGRVIDSAIQIGGAAVKGVGDRYSSWMKPKKGGEPPKLEGDALAKAEELKRRNLGIKVESGAKEELYRTAWKSAIKNGEIHPEMKFTDYLASKPKNLWNGMSPEDRMAAMDDYAQRKGIPWGPTYDSDSRQLRQEANMTQRGIDEINRNPDPYFGGGQMADEAVPTAPTPDGTPQVDAGLPPKPKQSYYVVDEGDVTQGVSTSATDNVLHGLRDMKRIRTEWDQMEGSPRGGITDAQVARIAYGAEGQALEEVRNMAQRLDASDEVQAVRAATAENKVEPKMAFDNAQEFLDDFYGSRNVDAPSQIDIEDFSLDGEIFKGRTTTYNLANGKTVRTLSTVGLDSGLALVDLLSGQLMKEARDFARLSNSISDSVDILEADGVGQSIKERLIALAKLRAETSAMSSYNLSAFKRPVDADELYETIATKSRNAAQTVNDIFDVLEKDPDSKLLDFYIDALSKAESYTNFNDLHEAMHRSLVGYSEGDAVERNAILRELHGVYINSIISGTRTVGRAVVGTGFNAVMRPVATIVGSLGSYIRGDDRTFRSAMYELGGMVEGVGEALHLTAKSWKAQIGKEVPTTYSQLLDTSFGDISDIKWEQQGLFFQNHGTDGEKAVWHIANFLRGLNKNPILTWSSKAMEASDVGWRHLIARGHMKAQAFNEAYDTLIQAGKAASDDEIKKVLPEIADRIHNKIWDGDGQITDEMAKLAGDEASLTKELTGWAAHIDNTFKRYSILRPWLLFWRTSYNSLELIGKHTPVLNNFVREVSDIKTLDINSVDDALVLKSRYGIETPEQLASARALIKGRETLGAATVFVAGQMYLNGNLTGNGPPNKQLRDTWTKTFGWQPRSIKVGDKYISYDAFEPMSTFLATVADIGDASLEMGENWTEMNLARLGYIFAMNVTNKSFLTGLTQLVDVFNLTSGRQGAVMAQFANGIFPLAGLRNDVGRLLSPGMRELQAGMWDSIRNRNLWSDLITPDGTELPYRYDVLNGQRLRDYDPLTRLNNAFNPIQINTGTNPTREFLFRSLYDVNTAVTKGPNGEELTARMKSKYQYLIGQQNLEAQLETLFQNPDIKRSILEMEKDRAAGRRYNPIKTLHNEEISKRFKQAQRIAWTALKSDTEFAQEAIKAERKNLADQRRRMGDYEAAKQILDMVNK